MTMEIFCGWADLPSIFAMRGTGSSISWFYMGCSYCDRWFQRGGIVIKFSHEVEMIGYLWLQTGDMEDVEGDCGLGEEPVPDLEGIPGFKLRNPATKWFLKV